MYQIKLHRKHQPVSILMEVFYGKVWLYVAKKWSIGILGASDIAYKKFLPALQKSDQFSFSGIASRNPERCEPFLREFGGQCYPDYLSIINAPEIDCIYLPLPPALHASWGTKALLAGKHLLMEKPFTTTYCDTRRLLDLAREQGLAVHENYMFLFHRQLQKIREIIADGTLGELRMIRTAFTFPFREAGDFRYQKELGGGALLDCGGYPILLAVQLLGPSAQLKWSNLRDSSKYGIETGGSAVLQNDEGLTAHIFFGMDDTYRCDLELWGSKASLYVARIFTAPSNSPIVLQLNCGNGRRDIHVEADDQFLNSIHYFAQLIEVPAMRELRRNEILQQSRLVEQILNNDDR